MPVPAPEIILVALGVLAVAALELARRTAALRSRMADLDRTLKSLQRDQDVLLRQLRGGDVAPTAKRVLGADRAEKVEVELEDDEQLLDSAEGEPSAAPRHDRPAIERRSERREGEPEGEERGEREPGERELERDHPPEGSEAPSTVEPAAGEPTGAPGEAPVALPTAGEVGGASESWERWLGIRGAALVGGVALVLAGIFFVQVAIERGWLNAATRDALSIAAGLLGLAAHGPLMRRGHRALSESVGGAGTVLVLGGAWAAARLHGLVPDALALVLMAGAVGAALLLAVRSNAQVLMAFALVGGFATPLLLDTAATTTYPLLGFLLVLNGAVLVAARVRRWSWAGLGAAVGTFLVQAAWLTVNEAPGGPWVVVLNLGLVPVVFGLLHRRHGEHSSGLPEPVTVSLLAPAVIALSAPPEVTSTSSLWPMGALLLLLVVLARVLVGRASLTLAAALTASVTLLITAGRTRFALASTATDWVWIQWAVCAVALAAVPLALAFLAPAHRRREELSAPFAAALVGLLGAPFLAGPPKVLELVVPFTITGAALTAVAAAAALTTRSVGRALAAGLAGSFAFAAFALLTSDLPVESASPPLLTAVGLALAATALGLAGGRGREDALALGATLPLLLLLLAPLRVILPVEAVALALSSAVPIAVSPRRRWTCVSFTALALTASLTVMALPERWHVERAIDPWTGLGCVALILAAVALAALWRRAEEPGAASRGEILAVIGVTPALAFGFLVQHLSYRFLAEPFWLLSPRNLHLALAVGAAATLAAYLLGRSRGAGPRAAAVVAAAGAALLSLTAARALAFSWPAVQLALAGSALAFLSGRAHGRALSTLGSAVLCAASLGVVVFTFVLEAFSSEPFLIPLDVTVDHLMTAAALAVALLGMRGTDEAWRFPRAIVSVTLLVVAFSWINAVILNNYSTGERIAFDPEKMQARDLTMSIAWTVFAAALLGAGLRLRASGLRWASLVVLVVTVLKVFLYDLGSLEGLARVGSFLGLAVCLLGVSLLYGKVLGHDPGRRPPGGANLPPHDDGDGDPDAGGVAP